LVWSNSAAYSHEWLPLYLIQEPWRMMLGLETIPALLFFLLLFFIPESPHWLVAQKRISAAERTLTRLFGRQTAKKQLQETIDALATQKNVSWRILLSPVYRTPMVIGVCLAILGQFMGVNAIFYYGPTIFQQAGAGSQGALDFQIIVGVVNVLSTILAMYLVDKIGRKKLVYVGVGGMLFILVGISIFFMSGMNNPEILLLMILLYIFFAAISICVVIWVLLSEMYPLKVRGFAMSCAGFSLWIGTYLIGQVTPVLLGGIGAAWTFGLFALMCLPYLAITYYLVPETTGKTLEEIERIWQTKAEKNDRAPFS
ncbi:MAG: sugar porter family MFS transporter, partial [Sphingobacterium sp.]